MSQLKITILTNQPLSALLPKGSLILSCSILTIVLVCNVLERVLFQKVYGSLWDGLQCSEKEARRRSFTYYHVGAIVMSALLVVGAFPTFDFLVGRGDLSAHFGGGESVTHVKIGDVLFTLAEVYSAYYIFELAFRARLASAISIAHHIGLLMVIQTSLAMFSNLATHREATIQFYMCMIWGMFHLLPETFMILC